MKRRFKLQLIKSDNLWMNLGDPGMCLVGYILRSDHGGLSATTALCTI